MAISFSVMGTGVVVEIHVDDPGAGYVYLVVWDTTGGRKDRQVGGHALWRLLTQVTTAAASEDHGWHDLLILGRTGRSTARAILPVLQAAVVYAVAGTDRAERTVDEPDPADPLEPMCIRCDVGRVWADANPAEHPWCKEHGHTPYGVGRGVSWEDQQADYAAQRRRADAQR